MPHQGECFAPNAEVMGIMRNELDTPATIYPLLNLTAFGEFNYITRDLLSAVGSNQM